MKQKSIRLRRGKQARGGSLVCIRRICLPLPAIVAYIAGLLFLATLFAFGDAFIAFGVLLRALLPSVCNSAIKQARHI
jgi:hypothetical protein